MSNSTEKYGFEKCEMALPRYEDEKHTLPAGPPSYAPSYANLPYSDHKSHAAPKAKHSTDHNEADPDSDKIAETMCYLSLLLTIFTLIMFTAHWCVYGFRASGLGFTFSRPETFLELQLVSLQTQLKDRSAEHNGLMANYLSQVNVSLNEVILDLDASAAELGVLKCLVLLTSQPQAQMGGEGEGKDKFARLDEGCVKKIELYIDQALPTTSPQPAENVLLLTLLQNLQAMNSEITSYSAFLDDVIERAHVLVAELEVLGHPVRMKNETAATPGVDPSHIPVAAVEGTFKGSFKASKDLVKGQKEKIEIEEMIKNGKFCSLSCRGIKADKWEYQHTNDSPRRQKRISNRRFLSSPLLTQRETYPETKNCSSANTRSIVY
jgi:hypothetical protein